MLSSSNGWILGALLFLAATPAGADDLSSLTELSEHARVLALGEPAHGAHEPLALRNRVFEYLLEHDAFTAVALETAFTESRALHVEIAAAESGRLPELTRQTLSWGFGEFAENVELLQWLAAYNANPAHVRKLNFYGIDVSGADNEDGFSKAGDAVEAALQSVALAKPLLAERLRQRLEGLLPEFSDSRYSKLSQAQASSLRQTFAAIARALRENRSAVIAASSREDFEWASHDILMAQRLQSMFSVRSPRSSNEAILPEDYRVVNVRDGVMAENVLWVLHQEGPQGKVLVFAHNAHVMNASNRGGIWNVFAEPPHMMGQHLRRALGRQLVIVGTLAGETGPLWLHQRHPIRANYDTWLDVELDTAFDAIELIPNLTRIQ